MLNFNLKLLDEQVMRELESSIDKILEVGGTLKIDTIYPEVIFKIFDKLGLKEVKENLDFNGWDFDWGTSFSYGGRRFNICGNGYYGGFTFESMEN